MDGWMNDHGLMDDGWMMIRRMMMLMMDGFVGVFSNCFFLPVRSCVCCLLTKYLLISLKVIICE